MSQQKGLWRPDYTTIGSSPFATSISDVYSLFIVPCNSPILILLCGPGMAGTLPSLVIDSGAMDRELWARRVDH
jgi:hypothetical protein